MSKDELPHARRLCRNIAQQLNYNLLFRWFVGLSVDKPVWVPTVFSHNRDRLLAGDVAAEFLDAVLNLPEVRGLLSAEHFSVDGTLIQAWASMKSFRRKDGNDHDAGPGRNGERDFHNDRRSNETHASTTDPEARLAKKSKGSEAKLAFAGHLLMENRNGLLVDARLTHATGTAECEAALDMLGDLPAAPHATVGADKAYDTAKFVSTARDLGVTPHVAQNITAHRGSNIDGRTTRHDGYRLSQTIRKQIEEANGWIKEVAAFAQTKHRGLARVGWMFWTAELTEMRQQTLAIENFDKHSKQTRRAKFLAEMDEVVPWRELHDLIEPFYPKAGNGRPPIGLDRMLRLHFLQHWFNLSDPAAEEALYESLSMRRFVGIDLGREPAPDETTILNFRHLLERHNLGKLLFERLNENLASRGLKVAGGTIVDATIIAAPSSTKNEAKARDPEMHQTRKGQQWYFGMKLHIGVDSKTKLNHAMTTTPANVHDATVLGELLHGNETRVYGDQAYRGQTAVIREHAQNAKDFTNRRYRLRGVIDEVERRKNRTKSEVRAKVEHPIGVIKRVFGFTKVRYRGLVKNTQRLWVSCGLANLFTVRHRLLRS